MVPAREVLTVIKRSLCLITNVSKYISKTRWTKILETIDKFCGTFGADLSASTLQLSWSSFPAVSLDLQSLVIDFDSEPSSLHPDDVLEGVR